MTTVAEAVIEVRADGSRVRSDVARSTAGLGGIGRKAGLAFAGGFAAYGVAKLIKSSVELEAAYSRTMARIGVSTGAPIQGLERLDDLAMQLGADTVYSANEAAEAMLGLAKGGLSVAQIEAGALANTLTLAVAGELELAQAADVAVRAMGAFNLTGQESSQVTTALVGAADASSASVSDLAMSLSQAGGEANSAGLGVAQATGTLAAFAQAGIVGSDAGTSLRTMLMRLTPQTAKASDEMKRLGLDFTDSKGNFLEIEEIADQLADTFRGMSDSERSAALSTIFGADARRAANVLINEGEEGLRKYIAAAEDQTKVQAAADAAMSGTAGALERAKGAWETAQLQIGKGLAPAVEDAANAFADWLGNRDLEADARGLADAVEALWDNVEPIVDAGATLVSIFNDLPGPVKEFAVTAGLAAVAVNSLKNAMIGSSIASWVSQIRTGETRVAALGSAARFAAGGVGIAALTASAQASDDALATLGATAGGALLGFSVGGPIGAAIGGAAGLLYGVATATGTANEAMYDGTIAAADYADSLDQVTGAATEATRVLATEALRANGVLDVTRGMDIATRDLVGHTLGYEGATRRVTRAITEEQNRLNDTTDGYKDASQARTDGIFEIDVLRDKLGLLKADFKDDQRVQRENAEATQTWGRALKGIPKKVQAKLENLDYQPTIKELHQLQREHDLARKDVKTIIDAVGIEASTNQVMNYKELLNSIPSQVATKITQTVERLNIFSDLPNVSGPKAPPSSYPPGLPRPNGLDPKSKTLTGPRNMRITLDAGGGKTLTGVMEDVVSDDRAFNDTLTRMR